MEQLAAEMSQIAVRPALLGRDCEKNEYWFFKEEPGRLYVKACAADSSECRWEFYDDSESFEQLVAGLVPKGVREKELHENLEKLRGRLRFEKQKRVLQPDVEMEGAEESKDVSTRLLLKQEKSQKLERANKVSEEEKVNTRFFDDDLASNRRDEGVSEQHRHGINIDAE